MTAADEIAALRARLGAAGLGSRDLDWFARIGWADGAIPVIENDAQRSDYARREAALNAAIRHLSFAERAAAIEGKLAAAIGARIADWTDRGEDEDDG